jgi:hypothetical protein
MKRSGSIPAAMTAAHRHVDRERRLPGSLLVLYPRSPLLRTKVAAGAACYANCHIIRDGDTYRNRELYLFESDLKEPWEKSASRNIVVDGKLPAKWDVR